MSNVIFSYGVKSQYTSLVTKDVDTLYFITDTGEIYKGDVLISDKTKLNVEFTSIIPEASTSQENILYVATVDGKTTLWAKSGEAMVQVSGGEATEIADGVITLSKFADGVVATDLTNPNDTQIPTSKAVHDAIEAAKNELNGAIVSVTSEAAPEGKTGTVLKFTAKDGTETSITVADIFLSAATYDSASHKLKLTLNDAASSVVEVDLSDIIGNSLSDVKVGQDEAFNVELGSGGTLGGFKTGDSISADMSVETILKKLLMKQVPPTYTAPSVSIANNGGSASGSYEIGSTVTPKVRATFTQNDAGAVTSIQFQKNSSDVGDAQSSAPATYEETGFVLESTTSFRAVVNYAEGTVKKDNLGQDYPNGHIQAGSKTTSNYTFTPYRQGYFVGSTVDKATLTSATIRDMTKKNGAYSAQTIDFTVPVGAGRVVIACPATSTGLKKVINKSALNADVTSTFVKSTLDIEGADGYSAITYNVWTFIPDVAYGQEAVLAFTLG